MMEKRVERRRFPRIKDKDISVKLAGGGVSTISQSLDVSASGIYCKVDRHIPLMTRVQVVLTFPGRTKSSAPVTMDLDGVVVREHPVKKDGRVQYHDVAIFFNTLTPRERKSLVQYITRRSKKVR